jgi:hypothetical protein
MNSSIYAKGQSDCGNQHFYEVEGMKFCLFELSVRQKQKFMESVDAYLPLMKIIKKDFDEENQDENACKTQECFNLLLRVMGLDYEMDSRSVQGYQDFAFFAV